MAETRISDVIVPEVFAPYTFEQSVNTNKLLSSGAINQSTEIGMYLAGGGLTFNLSSWDSTANSSADYDVSDDDPASIATPEKIASKQQICPRLERNRSWSTTDLSGHLAGSDPMGAIATKISDYVNKQRNNTVVSTLSGFLACANMSTQVNTIATGITASDVIETTAGWGDFTANGDIIGMHSATYRSLQKQNLITFDALNVQDIGWGTYLNFTVFVDDAMPFDGVDEYTTVLFQTGGIGFGSVVRGNAVETDREPLQGNGGGVEILVVRDCYSFHINGSKWIGTAAGTTPSNAELATGTNWDIAAELKNIPVVALKHIVV
jgi:hypothetical protein